MFTQANAELARTRAEILDKAARTADALGLGSYVILVRRGQDIRKVTDESQIEQGDVFVAVAADAKGG